MSDLPLLWLDQALEDLAQIRQAALRLAVDDPRRRSYLLLSTQGEVNIRTMGRAIRKMNLPHDDMPWWKAWQERAARPPLD